MFNQYLKIKKDDIKEENLWGLLTDAGKYRIYINEKGEKLLRAVHEDDSIESGEAQERRENVEEVLHSILFDKKVLYFPTYRRVEEDLINLGYDERFFEDFDEEDINFTEDGRLIHFGMNDVQEKFHELTHEIERLSKEGLSKLSSEILSQLIKGIPDINVDLLDNIQEKDIEILLARVGDEITEEDKKGIRRIVSNKESDVKDIYSLFFLQKLISIYNQQRELDERIKRFRDVCNKYLVNKKVIYDESKIEIYIKVDNSLNNGFLELSDLSSGEKQIISIFSKIYLSEPDERYIILFDEPELSLSIYWQRDLLPDIYNSGKCDLLFAVTHSPFIFENELDKYATSLNEYFSPLIPELAK